MQAKQMMLGLLGSAILGGGVAVGGYKLLEPAQVAPQAVAANPQVRYTSEMRSTPYTVPEGLNFVAAAAAVTPAVVHVMTEYAAAPVDRQRQQMDPFLRQFFGDQFDQFQQQPQGGGQGSGSGVIIAANGYIVTNNHVIDKASKIEVVLDDKRKFDAELVGADPNTDLAVLKVKADNLPFVKYGNSDDVKVGQWVLAVGNPFNLNSTVTAGIISAKGRNIDILRRKDNMGIESFIQTDAVVNPGNSGGALVNLNGDLIGINSAIASHTGSFEGYAFAIPSSLASKVVDDLLKYKVVQRALLGVSIREVDAKLASEKKLNTLNGVYVEGLSESSAAAAAGLKTGDIITQINGVNVNTSSQLQEQVARFRPGDKIKVSYTRGGSAGLAEATLRNSTGTTAVVREDAVAAIKYEGATIAAVPARDLAKLGLEGGAKISGIKGSNFRETGMADGFIITHIDKNEVTKPSDVKNILDQARNGSGVLIKGVYPDGRKAYYPIGAE
ncbi:trypsin-like peptidase domain-containing protein [Hymenobacter sp. M29]|uniref:Trypsin-like peptidase domain-containing protein n=1 Tax=Hymenobacter mellowenesis TaxID=3063995 RepID=A0ABT9A527_9BACT|nr:trypsin-like peptidase domain-containing protein [Hymenobacter sp. M29]MDO7844946.1 trypsin-like peptidase domain-containing protein [Hymenobacter sp. M29]